MVTSEEFSWLVLVVRVPANPSRHRVAVWRELRRSGAIPLGQGIWALPQLPVFNEPVSKILELVAAGAGDCLVLRSAGHNDRDVTALETMYARAREEEWIEFAAECGHFLGEIDKEIAKDKLTLAELDEEEQSLDRLRRWHAEISRRDVFGQGAGESAAARLAECADRLEQYAQLVYDRVEGGQP